MIQAKGNYIIIKAERPKKSSIVLLKTGEYDEKLSFLKGTMTIQSIGEGIVNFKVGDRVILGDNKAVRYEGFATLIGEQESDDIEYFICKEESIAGIIV